LVVFVVLVRIIYIAVNKGFVVEFFKFIATFSGLFFSFHFYIKLADFLLEKAAFLKSGFTYPLIFILIYSFVWLIWRYIRVAIMLLFKVEPHALIERWFCLGLGFLRGGVVASLLLFNLYLLNIGYLNKSLENCFSFPLLKNVAPVSYKLEGKLAQRIFPDLKIKEEEAYEAKESL